MLHITTDVMYGHMTSKWESTGTCGLESSVAVGRGVGPLAKWPHSFAFLSDRGTGESEPVDEIVAKSIS